MLKHSLIASMLTVRATAAFAQARVEKNVVYGMYSGTALLMDVYRPAQSNGLGLIVVGDSGWYMPQRYLDGVRTLCPAGLSMDSRPATPIKSRPL